mmetsp:Transcript_25197/g.42204  ORF Transcript_25197/g.42204 Transcript_25197/m.42204 type:complete len:332 (-) Transcript_25197:71-1066(-)
MKTLHIVWRSTLIAIILLLLLLNYFDSGSSSRSSSSLPFEYSVFSRSLRSPCVNIKSNCSRRSDSQCYSPASPGDYRKRLAHVLLRGGVLNPNGVMQSDKSQNDDIAVKKLEDEHTRSTFETIYKSRIWGFEGHGSGLGSEPSYTTHTRAVILELIRKRNITSMLDAPCGGMKWTEILIANIQSKLMPEFMYKGMDIVPSVIETNRIKYRKSHPSWQFDCGNLALCSPQKDLDGYDLIFTRDCLQHLPTKQIWQVIRNVAASSSRYWLVGSYDEGRNREITAGDYFAINLRAPPFNLSHPLEVLDEQTADGKKLLLYDISCLKKKLEDHIS